MNKKDIQTRHDLEILVYSFYARIRRHDDIGPFFNELIEDWNMHIKRFTDFWHANLFSTKNYKGKTLRSHIEVDTHFEHQLTEGHFKIWLDIWNHSVDSLFQGEKAHQAKKRACCMAHMMCLKMMTARKKQKASYHYIRNIA